MRQLAGAMLLLAACTSYGSGSGSDELLNGMEEVTEARTFETDHDRNMREHRRQNRNADVTWATRRHAGPTEAVDVAQPADEPYPVPEFLDVDQLACAGDAECVRIAPPTCGCEAGQPAVAVPLAQSEAVGELLDARLERCEPRLPDATCEAVPRCHEGLCRLFVPSR